MEDAVTKLGFSARAYDRILKRIRTSGCAEEQTMDQERSSFSNCRTSIQLRRVGNMHVKHVWQYAKTPSAPLLRKRCMALASNQINRAQQSDAVQRHRHALFASLALPIHI
jgi:hypothetical protein